jgi:hypothetical protein
MRRDAKPDGNQTEIVTQLRRIPGITVHYVHQLKNFCDILVGYRGRNYLFEIKKDQKKKLTPGEKKFQEEWTGQVNTVSSVEDILLILGIYIKERIYV